MIDPEEIREKILRYVDTRKKLDLPDATRDQVINSNANYFLAKYPMMDRPPVYQQVRVELDRMLRER